MDTFLLLFHPNPVLSQPAASQMMVTGPFARQFGFWFVLATGRPSSRTGTSTETDVRLICFPSTYAASTGFYCARQWSLLLSVSLHYPHFPSPTLPLPPCYFRQLVPTALPRLDSGWFLPPVVLPCLFLPPLGFLAAIDICVFLPICLPN